MAQQHGITETGAKEMMKEAYRASEGRELYEVGKALETEHHQPRAEAERAARAQNRTQSQAPQRTATIQRSVG